MYFTKQCNGNCVKVASLVPNARKSPVRFAEYLRIEVIQRSSVRRL